MVSKELSGGFHGGADVDHDALRCAGMVARQQPQQLTLKECVENSWKQPATWEGEGGVRDETKSATEVERGSRTGATLHFKSGR